MNRGLLLCAAGAIGSLASCAVGRDRLAGNGSETTTGISARVVDSAGMPAAGAMASLRPADWTPDTAGLLPDPVRRAVVGADGSVRFDDVPRGLWRVVASSGTLLAGSAPIASGDATQPTLRLQAAGSLHGSVALPSGSSHAWVRVPGLAVLLRTGSSGDFAIEGLPACGLGVEALVPGTEERRAALRAEVRPRHDSDIGTLSPKGRGETPPSAWTDSVRILLDPGPGEAGEFLTGFPLLVRLSDTSFDFAESQGRDLRFERAGHVLAHEVEQWDPVGRTAAIWVRLDTLVPGSGAVPLLLRHGNAASPDWSDGAAVFPDSEGWRGAWHLDPRAPGADATPLAHHGVDFRTLDAEGAIGRGRFCDTGWIRVPDHADLEPASLTLSVWARRKGSQVDNAKLLSKGNLADWHNSWSLQTWDSTERFGYLDVRTDSVRDTLRPAASLPDGRWTLVAATADAATGTVHLYVDGVAIDSSVQAKPFETFPAIDMPLFLGANFIGTLDEPRLAAASRPPAWMRLEWLTQRPGATALRFLR